MNEATVGFIIFNRHKNVLWNFLNWSDLSGSLLHWWFETDVWLHYFCFGLIYGSVGKSFANAPFLVEIFLRHRVHFESRVW